MVACTTIGTAEQPQRDNAATLYACDLGASKSVSIHAPVRGRHVDPPTHALITRFDPRPRERATRIETHLGLSDIVSIHAPVRGRRFSGNEWPSRYGFRSTPP